MTLVLVCGAFAAGFGCGVFREPIGKALGEFDSWVRKKLQDRAARKAAKP